VTILKKSRTISFFISLLIVLILNVATTSRISFGGIELEQTLGNYSLRVDSSLNETIYYVSANNEIIEFSIQCNDWGHEFGQGYVGLLVELIYDENVSSLNSWLILSGDTSIHYFTSETEINDIIQIKFSALNVYTIDFELEISESLPIWTYKTTLNILNEGFFGIERFAENYYSIEKIVLFLLTDFVVSFNYTSEILDKYNTISTFSGNVTERSVELITFTIEEGLYIDDWFQLKFDIEEVIHSKVTCAIYYDHQQTANIARIFLSTGNQEIHNIPIDYMRDNPSYYWTIIEDYIPPPPPPPFPILEVFIVIGIVGGLAIIFTLIGISGLRVKPKRRRDEIDSSSAKPSTKYYRMQKQRATYSPDQVYGVNFAQKTKNYSVEASDGINVTCSICLQKIDTHEQLIRCPSCDIAFHKNHLYQWILGNGNCPACKSRLRITEY
jgi:hypothetical protein